MKSKQKPGVVFQPRVYQALQNGIHTLVNAIRPTLGPVSGGVAIDHINKTKALPEFLDDGGVIARRMIELPNRDEDMGAMLLRSMLVRQHERVGDGTATSAVLFDAIFKAGVRYITAGGNAMRVRRHLEKAITLILDEIAQMTFKIEDKTTLKNMAFSLCHDTEMADMLGDIFDVIGAFGRLEIREDYGRTMQHEYVQGSYFYGGAFSSTLFTEGSSNQLTFENPAVFLCDFEIENHRDLFPVLQTAHKNGIKSLLIIARNLSESAVALLVTNNRMDKLKTMGVKLPGLNSNDRVTALEDLGVLTGATPFLKVTGDSLENITPAHFGAARRIWADMRTFGIVGGQGDKRRLRQHLQRLQRQYQQAREIEDRKQAQERIGNLQGGAATFRIGGFTEPEINARKRRAERTAQTLRAALQEGVVPGGGIALLNCRKRLQAECHATQDTDERAAYRILIEALSAPAYTIFDNAGYDPGDVMAKLSFESPLAGFDVVSGQIVDICEAGILDSAIVIENCLRNVISTAALALTIDSLIHVAAPEMVGEPQ